MGEGIDEKARIRRERDRDSLLGTTDCCVDQQHRTTFCGLKYAPSSYISSHFFTPAGFRYRCFIGSAWRGRLGPWGWRWQGQRYGNFIRGTRSSSSMWGEGLDTVEELQRARTHTLFSRYEVAQRRSTEEPATPRSKGRQERRQGERGRGGGQLL